MLDQYNDFKIPIDCKMSVGARNSIFAHYLLYIKETPGIGHSKMDFRSEASIYETHVLNMRGHSKASLEICNRTRL